MAALWVAICGVLLLGLVVYLVRRRPHVLPDRDGQDGYPYVVPTPSRQSADTDDDDDDGDDGDDAR